jgi:hypothetical protein
MGEPVPGDPEPGHHAGGHAPPERPPSPRRFRLRPGERRVDPRALRRVGVGGADRDLRRALSHAEGAARRDDRADTIQARARGAGRGGRSHERPEGRAAPDLQRVLDRRRRDRPARLRQLRRAGGLRAARSARGLGEGQGRPRSLRAFLARHQAEGGGRARRRGVPHLLRPARRRLLRRRRVPEGPDAPQGRCAAGQRDGLPILEPGRPADAGCGRDEGGEAASGEGSPEPDPDPRAAHLLWGPRTGGERSRSHTTWDRAPPGCT